MNKTIPMGSVCCLYSSGPLCYPSGDLFHSLGADLRSQGRVPSQSAPFHRSYSNSRTDRQRRNFALEPGSDFYGSGFSPVKRSFALRSMK